MPMLALHPRMREWNFRTESELVFFLKVLADDEKGIQEHQGKNSGTATYHRQVQDLLYIDLPASRKYFPVTYQMYFKIFEKRSLIFTYHILKRLVLAAQKNGQPTHFRRSIKQIIIEFDHSSYQSQLNSQSDMEQVANFNEFLNTKLSRQTEVRLIIDDIITEPCQVDEEESKRGPILSFLLPNACNYLSLNRVKCNFPKSKKKDLKKLFRFAKDLKILRFADLRTDSVRNLIKVIMGTDKHIDTLVLDLNDKHCGEPEDMEFSNILFNLKPHKVSNLFINYIYITQKTEMDTLKLMLRQINLLSDFEGKTTQIRIGECKHQIKFLEVLIYLFQYLGKSELIVTNLKQNNCNFEYFFRKTYSKKDRDAQKLTSIVVPNERDSKTQFGIVQIVKNLVNLKSLEIRGISNDKKGFNKQENLLNPEMMTYYKLCAETKHHLLEIKLLGIRFDTARDLSIFLEEGLNLKLLRSLDIKDLLFKPADYENLPHLYYVLSRYRNLRSLAIPIIEHKQHMSNTNLISGKMIREKLAKLQHFTFKLIAPIKLPSEQSLFLYLLLKELCENPTLNKIAIESEYTLFSDQLKKAISGGNLGIGERLWGLEIEYLGCKYGVEDQLELYKFLSLRYPWVKLTL